MRHNYPFLTDELARMEIRNHQWIESEKRNEQLSFVAAALDWIKKFGQDWIKFRTSDCDQNNYFEKRKYRRFNISTNVKLAINDTCLKTQTVDINLIGFSFYSKEQISKESDANIFLNVPGKSTNNQEGIISFRSQIKNVTAIKKKDNTSEFKVFVPFNEKARNYLRAHSLNSSLS